MTFLPARTRGAPGWACAQRGASSPRCCAVEPVSASGAMAVILSRCIARADKNALACWLPMSGDSARPGITAARLERCGSRGADSFGDQVRCGQRLAPWASAFRSLGPKLRARNIHARTPSRQYGSHKGAVRVTRRTRGSGFRARRLLAPRLHHEEGDRKDYRQPRGRNQVGLQTTRSDALGAARQRSVVRAFPAAETAAPGDVRGTTRTAPRSPRIPASSPRCRVRHP